MLPFTKTTDSPIAIGSDTDYSTDEKIVGTWIDGKPLYQRVVIGTTGNSNSWSVIETLGTTCVIRTAKCYLTYDGGIIESGYSSGGPTK